MDKEIIEDAIEMTKNIPAVGSFLRKEDLTGADSKQISLFEE